MSRPSNSCNGNGLETKELDTTTNSASMYLSFDDSALSSSKTMDAMTTALDGTLEAGTTRNNGMHLELSKLSKSHNDSLKVTMARRSGLHKMGSNFPVSSPLRPISKFLNEYKAFASTPSKSLNSSMPVAKNGGGGDATGVGLSLAFAGLEDKENERPSETSVPTLSGSYDIMSPSVDGSGTKTLIVPHSTKKANAELAKTISEAIANLERAKKQALSTETPFKSGIPVKRNSTMSASVKQTRASMSPPTKETVEKFVEKVLSIHNTPTVHNQSTKLKPNYSKSLVEDDKHVFQKKHVPVTPEPPAIIPLIVKSPDNRSGLNKNIVKAISPKLHIEAKATASPWSDLPTLMPKLQISEKLKENAANPSVGMSPKKPRKSIGSSHAKKSRFALKTCRKSLIPSKVSNKKGETMSPATGPGEVTQRIKANSPAKMSSDINHPPNTSVPLKNSSLTKHLTNDLMSVDQPDAGSQPPKKAASKLMMTKVVKKARVSTLEMPSATNINNKRLSVAVKTSLYSPVNRFNRRSMMPSTKPLAQKGDPGLRKYKNDFARLSIKSDDKKAGGLPPNAKQIPVPTASSGLQDATAPKTVMAIPNKLNNKASAIHKSMMPIALNKATVNSGTATLKRRANVIPSQSIETLKQISNVPIFTTAIASKPQPTTTTAKDKHFICVDCGLKFNIKSLMDAHRRAAHELGVLDVALNKKLSRQSIMTTSSVSLVQPPINQCRYCDKKFALERTLHIHLLQNCPKIPAAERRNLNYHEMEHVEKAQTPVFAYGNGNGIGMISNSKHIIDNGLAAAQSTVSHVPSDLKGTGDAKSVFAKPKILPSSASSFSGTKAKPKAAHVGVYRTPTKTIPCPSCKQVFTNLTEFTTHVMAIHTVPLAGEEETKSIDKVIH